MATVGLKGLWGLEQLDKTGIATWKLGLILISVAVVISYASTQLMSGMAPNPVFEPFVGPIPRRILAVMTFGVAFILVGAIFFILALARTIESDLEVLASFDRTVETSINKLTPGRGVRNTCFVLGLFYGTSILPVAYSSGSRLNLTVSEALMGAAGGGPDSIFFFIIMPVCGLVTGWMFAVMISQVISLVHAARHIKIDFLQLNDYANIANPGVRLFLYLIPFLSAFPLLGLLVDDPSTSAVIMKFFLGLLAFAGVLLLPFVYPVWILRNRIRDKKLEEMAQVTSALRGNREVAKTVIIQGLETPNTITDLLTHQMFLESRWEWPIASHYQKLILFGLLPPISWILAAMIENSIY